LDAPEGPAGAAPPGDGVFGKGRIGRPDSNSSLDVRPSGRERSLTKLTKANLIFQQIPSVTPCFLAVYYAKILLVHPPPGALPGYVCTRFPHCAGHAAGPRSRTLAYLWRVMPQPLSPVPRGALVLLTALLALGGCRSGESVRLRLDVPPDTERDGRLTVSSTAALDLGVKAEMHLDLEARLHQAFAGRRDGLQPVEVRLDSVDLAFRVEQGIIQNSDIDARMDADVDGIEETYRGRSVTLLYDDRARVQRIEGLDADLGAELSDSLARNLETVQNLLGDNFFARLSGFFAVLPEEAVGPGDRWTNTFEQDILGLPVLLENTYRLAERADGLVHVDVSGRFRTDTLRLRDTDIEMPFEGLSMGSGDLAVVLTGKQSGRIAIEEATGWTRRSQLDQTFALEFRFGLLTLPVNLTNTILLEPAERP
jgi:hypothetical protein